MDCQKYIDKSPSHTISRQSTAQLLTKERHLNSQQHSSHHPCPLKPQTSQERRTHHQFQATPLSQPNKYDARSTKYPRRKRQDRTKSPTLPWKKTFDVTHRHLQALIQTSINTAHFPTPFKTITTVVLRKTSQPGLHPIAPENILGKLIESVMTELLSYAVEEHQLIPV